MPDEVILRVARGSGARIVVANDVMACIPRGLLPSEAVSM